MAVWAATAAGSEAGRLTSCSPTTPRRARGRPPRVCHRTCGSRRGGGRPRRTTSRARPCAPVSARLRPPRTSRDRRSRHARPERMAKIGQLGLVERSVEPEPQPRSQSGGELTGRARGDDAAVGEHEDPVGQPLDFGRVVGRQQDRRARRRVVGDDRPGHGPGLRVHPGGRLIEERGPRAARPTPARNPVAGAPRRTDGGTACRATCRRPTSVEQRLGVARVAMEGRVLAERLERLGPLVDAAGLQHQAHPRPEAGPPRSRIHAEHADLPAVAPPIALDDLDGRRLAGAVRPEQGDDLAAADLERDTVDDRPGAVALGQPLDHDGGLAGDRASRAAIWRIGARSRRRSGSPIWIERRMPSRSTK